MEVEVRRDIVRVVQCVVDSITSFEDRQGLVVQMVKNLPAMQETEV